MGRFKKCGQEFSVKSRQVRFGANPDTVYHQKPSWSFTQCDQGGNWAFTKERVGDDFWNKILPFLRSIGSQSWSQILVESKKQHHTIPLNKLNKCAQDRLRDLNIDCDEVISLRLGGTFRIYGIWEVATCSILWYDQDHGDNDTCVCRSELRHT